MASPLPPDPYKILNVPKNAPLATIRSAHRKLVLTCHPDKFPDESIKIQKADEFHQVQQAYEILSDETRRQRYDERVKLAELRAELMADQCSPGSRRMAQEYVPRSAGNSRFEMRGETRYEEIHPRTPYEDDHLHARYEAHARRYDERPEMPRRTSVRVQEERRRRDREAEDSERDRIRQEKERIKADDKLLFRDQRKTRERDRRRSYDNKYQPRVEEETESDSDSTVHRISRRRATEPRKRHEEPRRREKADTPRRSARHYDSEDEKVRHASSHISKVEGKSPIEVGHRPNLARYVSGNTRSPPPRPPSPPSDSATRSSTRPRGISRTRSSATKDRRSSETAEQVGRGYESRRPSLQPSASDPHHIKIPPSPSARHGIPRAATMETRNDRADPVISSLKRATTSPVSGSGLTNMASPRHDTVPLRSSKLANDSGYSSSSTPEAPIGPPPLTTKTQYKYMESDDEARTPHTVVVEPEYFSRPPEVSPRNYRREPERPHPSARTSSSARVTPTRNSSYVPEPVSSSRHHPPPPLSRTESSRPSPTSKQLFGEVPVSYSPRFRKEDVVYNNHPQSSQSHAYHDRDPDRDSYYPDPRARPGMTAREGSFAPRVH